ncbi:type 1 glutamine amidotransferase domain-containing protein [Acinetobacter terrestris]|uniref:Type 1 glutamine amidotransferase n=1 Tax=Acinetobacter terrestris TaxID=2529843 RepID=A0ABX1US56_9GAMM|nr:type 1 glutamine amidotransferase domain-containing protein [Acinetobacter terrestris]NNH26040.1 type 1 glutamine amidotransferase [Acinetobacter terrestris]TCB39980.1 type 1 glutamine amidotransferase [Acinetobacter terrestris]
MTKKALFITSNVGVEQDELIKPSEYLQSKGIEVIHAAEEQKDVQTVKGDNEHATAYTPQTTLSKVSPEDYDILVIPGGTVNGDTLRLNEDAHKIIQHFTDNAKPIAAICHGPWVLINAERIKDKNLTSYKSIKLDLENAGANWVDEEVHRCNTNNWPLITSRSPDDISAFNQAILQELDN